jgi:hypothetical protein
VTVAGPRAIVEELDSVYTRRTVVTVTDSMPQIVALDTARLGVYVRPARIRIRVPLARRNPLVDSLRDSLTP